MSMFDLWYRQEPADFWARKKGGVVDAILEPKNYCAPICLWLNKCNLPDWTRSIFSERP